MDVILYREMMMMMTWGPIQNYRYEGA